MIAATSDPGSQPWQVGPGGISELNPSVGACCLPRARSQCGCQVVFIEPDGRLDEVLYEHTQRALFVTRPKSGVGVGHLVVAPEDMMMSSLPSSLFSSSFLTP
jgi:hypothetical protein